MPATKFVNIGLNGAVLVKDPSDDGSMPDMSTETTDISKFVDDSITFNVETPENYEVTPQDMAYPWFIGNEGRLNATLNFSTYNFDPNILVLAFGGTAEDTGSDGVEDKYEAPAGAFSINYKAIKIEGDLVDGHRMTLNIVKCALRGNMQGRWTTQAGQIDFIGQVIVPEDDSGELQTPWYFENPEET